ncbi:MAG: hypothetical protein ACLQOZ_09550 [Acidimicrobiales bacterium]
MAGAEPSLTLCSTSAFFRHAGPLTQAVGRAVRTSPTFAGLAASRRAGWQVRWTSHLLWLAAGEVPAARREWHLDRVGPGRNVDGGEVADFSDNLEAGDEEALFGAVSYFWPDEAGAGGTDLHTEFLMEEMTVPLREAVEDPRLVGEAIERKVGTLDTPGDVQTFRSNVLTWFGARTLHRPPVALRPGWRFFLRVGMYREPHSPYVDHRLICHRLWDHAHQRTVYRPAGGQGNLDDWTEPLSVRL